MIKCHWFANSKSRTIIYKIFTSKEEEKVCFDYIDHVFIFEENMLKGHSHDFGQNLIFRFNVYNALVKHF